MRHSEHWKRQLQKDKPTLWIEPWTVGPVSMIWPATTNTAVSYLAMIEQRQGPSDRVEKGKKVSTEAKRNTFSGRYPTDRYRIDRTAPVFSQLAIR